MYVRMRLTHSTIRITTRKTLTVFFSFFLGGGGVRRCAFLGLLFLFHILTRVQTIRFGPRGILVAGVFEKLMGLKVHWRLHQNVFLGTRKIGGRLNYMLYICLLVAQ
ncbi:hypothetical protein QBC42DRAFT_5558 [Cladorrhinum samala]|uniref:Secreted protein n=1 Tax=Cladorrhinum samala TaxID=585594 RepID=A0AAV9HIL3_9PEZI|nr:hypothetical protein QBC42DRAFT_5558 [Cladorrhinum samala]